MKFDVFFCWENSPVKTLKYYAENIVCFYRPCVGLNKVIIYC